MTVLTNVCVSAYCSIRSTTVHAGIGQVRSPYFILDCCYVVKCVPDGENSWLLYKLWQLLWSVQLASALTWSLPLHCCYQFPLVHFCLLSVFAVWRLSAVVSQAYHTTSHSDDRGKTLRFARRWSNDSQKNNGLKTLDHLTIITWRCFHSVKKESLARTPAVGKIRYNCTGTIGECIPKTSGVHQDLIPNYDNTNSGHRYTDI